MDRPPLAFPQESLPLSTEGIERYVWRIQGVDILIEVEGDRVRVNGELVERVEAAPPAGAESPPD